MKKRPNSELLQKKWKNNSSERDFFSKHFGLIHLAGLRVLKHFFEKKSSFLHLSLSSSCLFSCLVFIWSLLSSLIFSSSSSGLFFHLSSSLLLLWSLLSSLIFSSSSLVSSRLFSFIFLSLLFSFLVLSRLSFSVSLCLSLSFSVSLCLSLSLSVSLCLSLCLSVCVVWCVWCPRVYVQKHLRVYVRNASVCRFKTSPCVPAPRPHVIPHAGVVPVHTGTF